MTKLISGKHSLGTCAVGLQVGIREYSDPNLPLLAGRRISGVFGLVGWEDACHEPVVVRCQLAINGRPAPYYWLACANPMHHRDAWIIQHLDANGNVTRTKPGIRILDSPTVEPEPKTLPGKKKRRKKGNFP